MLPNDAVKEFKDLYRQQFGVALSDAEAARRANNVMRLYRAVLLPTRRPAQDVSEHHDARNNNQ